MHGGSGSCVVASLAHGKEGTEREVLATARAEERHGKKQSREEEKSRQGSRGSFSKNLQRGGLFVRIS